MKNEKPILFSGPMVRAILEGRKSQTRRIVKGWPSVQDVHAKAGIDYSFMPIADQPGYWKPVGPIWAIRECMGVSQLPIMKCAYGKPGGTLWVRETWCGPTKPDDLEVYGYRVTDDYLVGGDCGKGTIWHPSIHMPRRASRLTLKITDIRVEQLQQLSEEDAIAEGLTTWSDPPRVTTIHYGINKADVWETDPRKAFARLWDSINGEKAPWSSNPLVWVVQFSKEVN